MTTQSRFSRPYLQNQGHPVHAASGPIFPLNIPLLCSCWAGGPAFPYIWQVSSLLMLLKDIHIFLSMLHLKAQHEFILLQEIFHRSPSHNGLSLCHRESDTVYHIIGGEYRQNWWTPTQWSPLNSRRQGSRGLPLFLYLPQHRGRQAKGSRLALVLQAYSTSDKWKGILGISFPMWNDEKAFL